MSRRKKHVPGVSVYRRGKGTSWTYQLDLTTDPLTGERRREYKGGFTTEDEAWTNALESKATHDKGRHVSPSRRTVEQFMTEWLVTVRHELKPSAYQNYVDYASAYVLPNIGSRKLQEVNVQVLNLLYRRLLEHGRRKPDTNMAMYEYWSARRDDRDGLGPRPCAIAEACGTSIYAARAAVGRYRRGRTPVARSEGLAPKTVKNIHRMLHRALRDAVAWDYVVLNSAEHASVPRTRRSGSNRPSPWTLDELARWLEVAARDRFAGLWVLVATTGMRRSELAGAARKNLDLENGTLTIRPTRIVVAGHAEDSDGKTAAGERTISLDEFTVEALQGYLAMLDEEREAFGTSYPTHGKLMCFEDGRQLHPDTVTRRFNRLVDTAGVRRIRLHDIRHTYSTLALDSGADPKLVSDRVGHANMSVTFQIYTHRSTGKDRAMADAIANLIRSTMNTAQGTGAADQTSQP